MVMDHLSVVEEREVEKRPSKDTETPPSKKKKPGPGPLTKLLGDIFTLDKSSKNLTDHARNELVRYEAEATLDLDSNPLRWWMEREKLFPILSDFACKLFSLPATSVPSEQIFSCAGNVVIEKQSRLLAHNVNRLVFLYENQDV